MRTEVIKYLRNRDAKETSLVDLNLKEYTIEEAEQLSDIRLLSVLLATTAVDAVGLAVEHAEQQQSKIK
mgnify:FL=1